MDNFGHGISVSRQGKEFHEINESIILSLQKKESHKGESGKDHIENIEILFINRVPIKDL